MADKKTFTIEINGIEKAYDNTIKLRDAIKQLENIEINVKDNVSDSFAKIDEAAHNLLETNTKLNESFKELQQTIEQTSLTNKENSEEQTNNISTINGLSDEVNNLTENYRNLDSQLRDGTAGLDKLNEIRDLNIEMAIASSQQQTQEEIQQKAIDLYKDEIDKIAEKRRYIVELIAKNQELNNANAANVAKETALRKEIDNTNKSLAELITKTPQATNSSFQFTAAMASQSNSLKKLKSEQNLLLATIKNLEKEKQKNLETIAKEQEAIDSTTQSIQQYTGSTLKVIEQRSIQEESINNLNIALKQIQEEYNKLSNAERKSAEGKAMLTKINQLTKAIATASDKNYGYVKSFNDLSVATGAVNSVFKDVSTLFKEGSSIAKTFGVNIDSVTTILDSMQTAIDTVASVQKIMNTVNSIATVVQQGLNQAIKSNPIMAMVSALILVVTTLYSFIKATDEASEASEKNSESTRKMNERMEETNELHKKAAESAGKTRQAYEELRRKWKELKTDQEKDQFIKENQDKFNKLGIEVNNVKDAENLLINNTDAFIASMKAKALATAAQELAAKKYAKYLEAVMQKEYLVAEFKKKNPTIEPSEEVINKGLNFLGINLDKLEEEANFAQNFVDEQLKEKTKSLQNTGIKDISNNTPDITTPTNTPDNNTDNGKKNDECDKDKKQKDSCGCSDDKKQENAKEEIDTQEKIKEIYKDVNKEKENLHSDNIERSELERKANAKTVGELAAVQEEEMKRLKVNQKKEIDITKEKYKTLIIAAGQNTKQIEAIAEQQKEHINEITQKQASEINTINKANQQEQIDLLNKNYDEQVKIITDRNTEIEELEKNKTEKKSDGSIDIEGTKKNLSELGELYGKQKTDLEENEKNIKNHYDALALIYDGDSDETEKNEALKQKAIADNLKKLASVQKQIDINAKESSEVVGEHYKELAAKVTEIAGQIKDNVATIFSAMSDMFKAQVEEANTNLTNVTKQYDEVVEKRKESQDKLKSLEEEAKTASGGRAMVVQEQIARQMEANNELAAQEKDLAKQKEKAEKEKAKKEKQQKKVELAQKLITTITDTATGVAKAVSASPMTFGLPWSAFAAATGAIQSATIIKQMSKLEDGGMLSGKRHSQGGMRIEGTNIEVEGDEYVVNRISTRKNLGLINYINKNRKELKAEDINSYFARTGTSQQQIAIPTKQMYEQGGMLTNLEVVDSISSPDNDRILEAISQINFKPVVSVVDITSAQNNLSEVKDIAGA